MHTQVKMGMDDERGRKIKIVVILVFSVMSPKVVSKSRSTEELAPSEPTQTASPLLDSP